MKNLFTPQKLEISKKSVKIKTPYEEQIDLKNSKTKISN